MLKINDIITKGICTKPTFKGENQENPIKADSKVVSDISNVHANDFNVNTPISYKFLGEIPILGDLKAKSYRLANGQNVIILPKKGPTVLKTYVNVGSMNEPDNLRGISHYIEHNLFNGTKELKPGEFFNKVNQLGASTNASTSFSATDFYISSQLLKSGDLEEKIKIHSDMLQNPVFAPDMLDKERGPVISEISMVMDDPNNAAMNLALKNLFQINTKSPDLVAGTIDNIRNVTRDDVLNYYNTHYTPNNFTTVITGDIEADETMSLISKYFTKQNPPKPMVKKFEELTPRQNSIRIDESSDKAVSSTLVMAFAGPENTSSKEKIATEALMALLSGNANARLTTALDKLNLDADVGIEKIGNKETDKKAVMLMTSCTPDKVDEVINTIYKEIFEIQNGTITDKEFQIMKKKLASSIEDVTESSAMLNGLIGSSVLDNDKKYLADYENILKNLTIQDVQDAAKKFLDLNKVSIATVNPTEKAAEKHSPKISFGNNIENKKFVRKEVYDTSKILTNTLPNNVELILRPTGSDITYFDLAFKCVNPPNIKPGVTEILAEMLNRGSILQSKEEFFDKADLKGIDINFSASPDGVFATAKTNPENSEEALKLAKEVLMTPRFTEAEFLQAKAKLKEALAHVQKSAEDNILEVLFKDLPFAASKDTIAKNLDNITFADITGCYAYIMRNAHGVCTASAPLEKNPEIASTFRAHLTAMPVYKPFTTEKFNSFVPLAKSGMIMQVDERNQADVVKSYKFKTNSNIADQAKFELLNIILGGNPNSRLFKDLRENQKLAYRVRSNIDTIGNTGIMSLTIKTTTDNPLEGQDKLNNLKKSLDGFDSNIHKIMTENVTDEELDSAKLYIKTKILDSTETSAGKIAALEKSKATPYGLEAANMFLTEVDSVTKEDIIAAANYIFSNPSLTSVVASNKTIEHFKTPAK